MTLNFNLSKKTLTTNHSSPGNRLYQFWFFPHICSWVKPSPYGNGRQPDKRTDR